MNKLHDVINGVIKAGNLFWPGIFGNKRFVSIIKNIYFHPKCQLHLEILLIRLKSSGVSSFRRIFILEFWASII